MANLRIRDRIAEVIEAGGVTQKKARGKSQAFTYNSISLSARRYDIKQPPVLVLYSKDLPGNTCVKMVKLLVKYTTFKY